MIASAVASFGEIPEDSVYRQKGGDKYKTTPGYRAAEKRA